MLKPDYNNSIVNIISTLQQAMGDRPVNPPLANGLLEKINEADNVVLFMLDGLGYDFLSHHKNNTIFDEADLTRLTSVFPTTTASAVTSFATGLTPAQHAVTGWFMYLHDPGLVSAILPYVVRGSAISLTDMGMPLEKVVGVEPLYTRIEHSSHVVSPAYIVDSTYSNMINVGAKCHAHESLEGMFSTVASIINSGQEKKYIYSYWSDFDATCHMHGVNSQEAVDHFSELAKGLEHFLASVHGSNTLVLITADHGLLDTTPEHTLQVHEHPEIQDALLMPLCGEPRAAYCYVHPDKVNTFVEYVEKHWSGFCELFTREEIIKQQLYGLGDCHPQLARRVGDYVLLMKDNYIIKDKLHNERPFSQIGVHGGLSEKELYVPLLSFTC